MKLIISVIMVLCAAMWSDSHVVRKPIYNRYLAHVQRSMTRNSLKPLNGAIADNAKTRSLGAKNTDKVKSDTTVPKLSVPTGSNVQLDYEPVYVFGKAQKSADFSGMKKIPGGKGSNLAVMSSIGLSVPPGFTITTEVCNAFHKSSKQLPENVWANVVNGLKSVEEEMGRVFGDAEKPLLVSVRSGAAISMPGMMDTALNLGLNDKTVKGLAKTGGERFAMDSYRRFLNMFGDVVMGIPHSAFEAELNAVKAEAGVTEDNDLTVEQLSQVVQKYKKVFNNYGKEFVEDPMAQLYAAIYAVFDSWNSDRAIKYRAAEGITGLLGTAVNVQAMVYGNMGDTSGTGVCFTRDPNTGENKLYGEYLINAQGEDVVAGIRTPLPIKQLEESLPEAYAGLIENVEILEKYYGDMQDIEFTVQEGKLYMLQTRAGKRVGAASVKIAVDMVKEELCTPDDAVMMVKPEHLNQLLHPQFSSTESSAYKEAVSAKGLPASPGAAVGKIVFTAEDAEAANAAGESCILVRDETSPEDVGGMWAAEGVLTARGGMTSHAAVVARGWGKPCICGCESLAIDEKAGTLTINKQEGESITLQGGDMISLNGDTGEILVGEQKLNPPSIDASPETIRIMKWVDERRSLRVMANADTPADAREARRNGAQGIGLTRTEHMFFEADRIRVVRRMILSKDDKQRQKAIDELLPFQRKDFEGILEAMDGLPVTVRLLDPPLHEFLPAASDVDEAFANDVGMTLEEVRHEIERMVEVNPMLGLRGCRLGVVLPELVEMQARALIEAALNIKYDKGLDPRPEIMIPLVGSANEFSNQAALIRQTIKQVISERRGEICEYRLGTMIEVPRAALTAEQIAEAGAEFFSYGTNDLTQMTYGFSRDDVGGYLPTYLKSGILETDPFQSIDEEGVGQLIHMSAEAGRRVAHKRADKRFKAGICGEHGGDPQSVNFFVRSGLDYVSCSPFRVPVARLAAAQVEIEMERETND
eukprot:CAMPEP_0174995914 /NCGR_PEP_ID=MMETSP0005-20121125/103_1 /TAXON_ID=420556 /ORGANISM="Ochromonas sp., Strain CCMP1393" /LENGTH=983 /DNA_ID=CAMNT_0016250263 /DNA_START=37 /DNA_END=2988 /DNA_ORIENTATION=+